MAKRELRLEPAFETPLSGAFVRYFQESILLLLKQRGILSETQYREGLRLLEETRR
jgi:hypothetical protein